MKVIDQSRVKAYADTLQQEGDFQYLVLASIAANLKYELKQRGKDFGHFDITFDLLAALSKQFSKAFTKSCWKNSAEKALELLDKWANDNNKTTTDKWAEELRPQGNDSDYEGWKRFCRDMSTAEFHVLKTVAHSVAFDVLQQANAESLSTETIETLLGQGNKQPPATEPSLFLNSTITPVPTPHVMVSSTELHLRKDRWGSSIDGIACYKHLAKSNPNNCIEHYIGTPGDITLLPWEEAQQIIDKLGFDTAKLHLIFAAHAFKQEKPWKSKFSLKATDIIKNLGWDRRTDIPKHQLLLQVASAAYLLDCLLVKSTWVEGRNAKGQLQASTPTGRLWNVLNAPSGTLDLFSGKVEKPDEVYITVQPGLWTQNTLNKAGSKAKEALYQFGYLAEEILRIDPYHNELSLRLAIHLTMQSRFHQSGVYKVSTLLEEMLPQTVIDTACCDNRKSYDLKQRWDSALKTLVSLRWQIRFDDHSYPEWFRPGSKVERPEGWRKFKIFDRLLEAKITIKPPAPIPSLVAAGAKPLRTVRKLPAARSPLLTGEQIRRAREVKCWSQRKLAGWVGVSQSLINHWEKGSRSPNSEQQTHLKTVLDIE